MDTYIFKWCVVRCGSKNAHKQDICLKEYGLRVQILLNYSRLNSQHNWEDLYDRLIRMRIFILILEKIFI